jgi:hypothetical protein
VAQQPVAADGSNAPPLNRGVITQFFYLVLNRVFISQNIPLLLTFSFLRVKRKELIKTLKPIIPKKKGVIEEGTL